MYVYANSLTIEWLIPQFIYEIKDMFNLNNKARKFYALRARDGQQAPLILRKK